MWALLSDSEHAANFDHLGEAYAPLRQLVEHLAKHEYANRVHAFRWMTSFNLTTSPTEQETTAHDQIGIEYLPEQGVFRFGYNERIRPSHNPSAQISKIRVCTPQEVGEVVDRCVRRLLISPRPPKPPEGIDVKGILVLGVTVLMFLFMVCFALGTSFQLQALSRLGMGLFLLSTALLLMGVAWNPNLEQWNPSWEQPPVHPRWGEMVGPPNWLISLGGAACFCSIGTVLLMMACFGRDVINQYTTFAAVGAFVFGVSLCAVGVRYSQRQVETILTLHTALTEFADRHDSWFPKGEASPEASLSVLHRENSTQVTAAILRGRTVPEAATRALLHAGYLLTPETCGWHYTEGLRKGDDPRLALFWDKTAGLNFINAFLSNSGHFVCFVDGSVKFISDNRWQKFLAEQEWLRADIMRFAT
jgi:hypothetical protein